MPRYAALARNDSTGEVSIIENGPGRDVCLAWMRNLSGWGLGRGYTPLAGLANIAGLDRLRWVDTMRQVPEMKDYIITHEDWQVLPIEWSWQEILWAYSGVRQIWENEKSVVNTFRLLDMGYSPRDAWLLGLMYGPRYDNEDSLKWNHKSLSTGHNCIVSTNVPRHLPRSIRSALKTAREIGLPFKEGIKDDFDGICPTGDLGYMYELVRKSNDKRGELPQYFSPVKGGELSEDFLRYMR